MVNQRRRGRKVFIPRAYARGTAGEGLETAIREVREETGIDLAKTKGKVIKVGEWKGVDKGEKVKILAVFYLFKIQDRPAIKLSHEHDEFAWLDKTNYKQFDSNPELHELIEALF